AGERPAVEHAGAHGVAGVAKIRIGPGRRQGEPRGDRELGAQLDALVAGAARVLVVDPPRRVGGDRIRDQLSAHFRIKQSHRVIQSSGDVAAYSELIGRRLLGLERGLKPPAPLGRLVSSVVVGVSKEVPMLPYSVSASDGVPATPMDPERARISRSPESSGLPALIKRSCA